MTKQLTITTAMAAALITLPACSSNNGWDDEAVVANRDTAVCVDQNGTRVDDDRCSTSRGGSGMSSGLLWYYIGRNSAVPYYGDSVRDRRFASGSYQPRAGASYFPAPAETRMTRSRAVSRGGLGSTSRRFGSGRS